MEKGIPSNMYKEYILELYKSPRNLGILKNPTHEHTEYNSLCGDEMTIQMIVKNGKVQDAKFSGSGCVISIVSSSLLTDKIRGMPVSEIKKLNEKEISKLLKLKINPARIKCSLLCLEAVKKALKNA